MMKIVSGFKAAKNLLDRTYSSKNVSSQFEANARTEDAVRKIINTVVVKGDDALYSYTERFDHVKLKTLRVTPEEISKARSHLSQNLLDDLKLAADRIEAFHRNCRDKITSKIEFDNMGKQIRALNRIGIYVPGGTASYPSTVLMTAIPARVAGVNEIILVSPPQKDGNLPSATIAAAEIAGVNQMFKVGGAQAIAALAYGTGSIPQVDKICGPGNIFVATAKKLVYGIADIDGIQGPSEIIVVADNSANPVYCAADLIAQAEHDELSIAILITDSKHHAENVLKEIDNQLKTLKRRKIIVKSLDSRGLIVVVKNISESLELVNLFAPEHLLLSLKEPRKYLSKIKNAGCVFLGEYSPVVLGDYAAGPSHVLPTGGTARFSSPLGIETFLKSMNYVALNKREHDILGPTVIRLAKTEGLDAHANAINIRLKRKI